MTSTTSTMTITTSSRINLRPCFQLDIPTNTGISVHLTNITTFAKKEPIFNADEIIDGIYIGDYASITQPDKLNSLGITHILSLVNVPTIYGFKQHTVPILDKIEQNIRMFFEECINFIDSAIQNKTKILVHCHAGISRSVAIVCAYIIHKHKTTFAVAIKQIQQKRQKADPNLGFCVALDDYYTEITTSSP